MESELVRKIRTEISAVESELKDQKVALKTCSLTQQWDIEVAIRALRVRLEELERNLEICQ